MTLTLLEILDRNIYLLSSVSKINRVKSDSFIEPPVSVEVDPKKFPLPTSKIGEAKRHIM